MFKRCAAGIAAIASLSFGCMTEPEPRVRIGFSQCVGDDIWRQAMLEEMERELAFHPGFALEVRVANGNTDQQADQIASLVDAQVDLLIVSPNEAAPLKPAIQMVEAAGIPVVVLDRKIAGEGFSTYIGANNDRIGQQAAEYVMSNVPSGRVLEITGLLSSSPAQERSAGFHAALDSGRYRHFATIEGDWTPESIVPELVRLRSTLETMDSLIVFSHNDFMAVRASELLAAWGTEPMMLLGIDGLPEVGMKAVQKGTLDATFLYPTGGTEAIRAAIALLEGEPIEKTKILLSTPIDARNVDVMLLQIEKIRNQALDIYEQTNLIRASERNGQRQQWLIVIQAVLLFMLLGAIVVIVIQLQKNKVIARALKSANAELSSQQEDLKVMSEQAKVAHEARLQFFTNISHEFRTPLTLIVGPIQEILERQDLPKSVRSQASRMKKNALRLLRMIDQLMDLRRIEGGRMVLQPVVRDLVQFTQEIVDSFQPLAAQQGVELTFVADADRRIVAFDPEHLDKVFFNLLSNAFKHTNRGGAVRISLDFGFGQTIRLRFTDTGTGIAPDLLPHIFERFTKGYQSGTGIGLNLSKELIELHDGTLSVESVQGSGTTFTIELPLRTDAKAVLQESDQVPDRPWLVGDLVDSANAQTTEQVQLAPSPFRIAVVDDNPEIVRYVSDILAGCGQVDGFTNSQEAWSFLKATRPHLVVLDRVMPRLSGLELTGKIRESEELKDTLVVMLTARTRPEDEQSGLESGADLYIGKPFLPSLLLARVQQLLTRHVKLAASTRRTSELSDAIFDLLEQTPGMRVEEVSAAMGLSRVQLFRRCKAELNLSPKEVLMNWRMERCKLLLREEPNLSISEIAEQLGFKSSSQFSGVFRKRTGQSPSEYREIQSRM